MQSIMKHPLSVAETKARVDMPIGSQFARFTIVGIIGFLVDSSVLYFCLHGLGFSVYGGRLVSYFMAATSTWYLNRKFTFTCSNGLAPTHQWARFVVTNGLGGFINFGIYSVIVTFWSALSFMPLLGVAVGSIAGLGFNFTASRLFVFKDGFPTSRR